MKRLIAAVATALLLFSACGGGDDAIDALATPLPEATEQAAATEAPSEQDEAEATDDAGDDTPAATAKVAASKDEKDGGSSSDAEPDALVMPKAGTYTFDAKGEATDPTNPAAPPQSYEGTATADVSRSGNTVTREDSADNQPGSVTLVTRYEDDRILFVSFKAQTTAGDYSCKLDTPMVIATFPVKVGQKFGGAFKGSGNACDGSSVAIEVRRQEAAKDASGKSWDTWVIFTKQTIKSGQLTLNTEGERWMSPDLGVEIKANGKSSGTFGATKFSGKGTTVLKDYP